VIVEKSIMSGDQENVFDLSVHVSENSIKPVHVLYYVWVFSTLAYVYSPKKETQHVVSFLQRTFFI
jgi:hypothetical protein